MGDHDWLLFLPQLPSSPSSLRVLVWRRLRAAGALGLQHGVWVLPHRPEQARVFRALLDEVAPQGGSGLLFAAHAVDPALPADIVARFRDERAEDYREFASRCRDFLAEIAKETALGNFGFAELEENEQDLQKLAGWLGKIRARDFFGGEEAEGADRQIDGCRQALDAFTRSVYAAAGLSAADTDEGD
jgi:hypothetical protein